MRLCHFFQCLVEGRGEGEGGRGKGGGGRGAGEGGRGKGGVYELPKGFGQIMELSYHMVTFSRQSKSLRYPACRRLLFPCFTREARE